MATGKTLEMYDVGTATAVRIGWPPDAGAEAVIRFQPEGRPALTLPASVVELAAAVLRDPSLLTAAERV